MTGLRLPQVLLLHLLLLLRSAPFEVLILQLLARLVVDRPEKVGLLKLQSPTRGSPVDLPARPQLFQLSALESA